jgi:hypothetical protein
MSIVLPGTCFQILEIGKDLLYSWFMDLKPQDVVVLLKIAAAPPGWTIQSASEDLGLSLSAVHRSLRRLEGAGLFDPHSRHVNVAPAHEFLQHGLRYVMPPRFRGETRGIPTGVGAPPLRDRLAPSNSLPPVWPHPFGTERGIALEPIHRSVPEAARRDPDLAASLALVDALRMGDARVRELAGEEILNRLAGRGSPE